MIANVAIEDNSPRSCWFFDWCPFVRSLWSETSMKTTLPIIYQLFLWTWNLKPEEFIMFFFGLFIFKFRHTHHSLTAHNHCYKSFFLCPISSAGTLKASPWHANQSHKRCKQRCWCPSRSDLFRHVGLMAVKRVSLSHEPRYWACWMGDDALNFEMRWNVIECLPTTKSYLLQFISYEFWQPTRQLNKSDTNGTQQF